MRNQEEAAGVGTDSVKGETAGVATHQARSITDIQRCQRCGAPHALDTESGEVLCANCHHGGPRRSDEQQPELPSTVGNSAANERQHPPCYTARFPGLVDIVQDTEGQLRFLVLAAGQAVLRRDWEGSSPPPREQLPYLLPQADSVVAHLTTEDPGLFDDLVAYYLSASQLPSEDHAILLAAWTAHTYLMERWEYTPILCLFAVPERGKTRTGKAITYAAYRGVHTETLNEASLFRLSETIGATLFLDVTNLWRKAKAKGSEDILLQRFETGSKVPRVLWPERGPFRDTRYFDIYGPTVVATNEAVHHILDTRAITIVMPDADRDFPNPVTAEGGLHLRERLVAFRARHLEVDLPYVPKPAMGRLGDILQPLAQIVRLMAPQQEDAFRRAVAALQADRLQEKAATLEARILEAIMGLADRVEGGLLSVAAITAAVNEGHPEKWQKSAESVGRRLTALGFVRDRVAGGTRAVVYDRENVKRLATRYGVCTLTEPSLLSQPSSLDTAGGASGEEPSPEPSELSVNRHPVGRYENDSSDGCDSCFTCKPESRTEEVQEMEDVAESW